MNLNIKRLLRPTFWKVAAAIILTLGLYSIYLRFTGGLAAVTNLNDYFPWGLWIGFDILCGVGMAAGGFTLCAVVYIFNIKKFKPIIRPTILTAFLGYLLVILALLIDLGRPWAIWHAIIMWNPHSVMFEVAWCVMLYTTVLFLEFSPVVLEKFKAEKLLKIIRGITIPLVVIGILLSTLHQSSLGALYLIVPTKMHPLWYSINLPWFFYLSAIGVGCAMIIFESYLSAKAFKKNLEFELVSEVGRWIVVVMGTYLTWRFIDLILNDKLSVLFINSFETYLFWLEIVLGAVIPVILLAIPKIRLSRAGLFVSACFVIGGFLLNRLNVSVTSLQGFSDVSYFPSIYEIIVTLFLVTLGVIIFNLAVQNLPVYEKTKEQILVEFEIITDDDLKVQEAK
ncbi:MAG: NrfD/PsrC family molybdoenzyme membrane anchor subunit [Ignavibacteria bacterium]